jgi:murein DD-endopeptidase MepM/ murein hydrolase activator NlpD
MNIIFVSNSMEKAKTLSTFQVWLIAIGIAIVPALIVLFVLLPYVSDSQGRIKHLLPTQLQFSFNNPQKHLDAYALQIGELQARIVLLDAQSQRLEKLAGAKVLPKPSLNLNPNNLVSPTTGTPTTTSSHDEKHQPITHSDISLDSPATLNTSKIIQLSDKTSQLDNTSRLPKILHFGGPLVRASRVSEADIQAKIAELMENIDFRTEQLSMIEANLLQQTVLKDLLPNSSPVRAAFNSSSYGWRYDPFNGNRAFHEGLDFTAVTGTPIYAAAGGIVSFSGQTNDYGNIIKVEHGAGLETRYAHASRLLVRNGQRVEKGQKIAEVGSTGRSTGPHLHYEIRLYGNSLDPRKYLNAYR